MIKQRCHPFSPEHCVFAVIFVIMNRHTRKLFKNTQFEKFIFLQKLMSLREIPCLNSTDSLLLRVRQVFLYRRYIILGIAVCLLSSSLKTYIPFILNIIRFWD